jgi:hypothetical protein
MLPSVNTIRDLGSVGKGGSGSHFFHCDDDKEYIVKFADNTKTVINELVCGSIALGLGLPAPNIALVDLDKDLIDLSSDLRKRDIRPGLHIGFARLPNAVDFQQLTDQVLADNILENSEELCGVIC